MEVEHHEVPVARQSSLFARRGAVVALTLAVIVDLIGLGLGLSEYGYGWAFQMPLIALSGIVGLTASVGGLILSILRLIQQRGKDVAIWFVLAGLVVTGLGGLVLILLSLAASASV
jgi:hypothetical protein